MNNYPPEITRRILIIDDDRTIHDYLRNVLAPDANPPAALEAATVKAPGKSAIVFPQIHFEIDSAFQGQEGLNLVKKALDEGRPYSMAFVDIRMSPGWDGVETTQKIWAVDPDVQIVLCTAFADFSAQQMFEKIGVCDRWIFLKKPFAGVEALQAAHALSEKWSLQHQSREKMKQLEVMVAERTSQLQQSNQSLQTEVADHKRTENQLRLNREEFKDLFDNAPVGFHELDAQGRFVRINNTELNMLGYSADELLGQFVWTVSAEEETTRRVVLAKLAGQTPPSHGFERMFRRKDGSHFLVMITDSRLKHKDGAVIGLRAVVQDITERKRVATELDYERDLWQTLLDNSTDHIYFKDTQSRFIKVGKAQALQLGADSPEDLLGKNDFDFFTDEHARPAFEDEQQIIRTGQPMIAKEEREVRKDGRVSWASSTKIPMRDRAGKIVGIMGISRDITEHKKAEDAMRETEERFTAAFEHAPIGVALVLPNGRYLKVNRAMCDLVGYSETELLARTFQDITVPEDLEADLNNVRRLLAGEIGSYHIEKRYVHKRGHFVTILLHVSLIRDAQGQPRYFISQVQDITERKRAEADLNYERELLRALLDNSMDRIYFKDTQSRLIRCSNAMARQLGAESQDQLVGKTDFDLFTQEHARPAYEDEQEIIRTGKPFIAKEEREVWKDGHVTWVSSSKMPWFDAAGKIIGIVGISRDITEQKKAADALIESQRLYHSLVEQLPANVWRKDADGRFIFVNSRFCKSKNKTADEILGRTASAIDPKEVADQSDKQHQAIMLTGQSIEKEESRPLPDGTTQYLQVVKGPVFAADGRIIGSQGIQLDITELKRLEAHLFQAQKMETIGKLAGGVAHEFNSILTAIMGQSDLILSDLPSGSPLASNVTEINKAADKAAMLTRQLLAYGRKQFLQQTILDLNQVLSGMDDMLRHLMGAGVEVQIVPSQGPRTVKADAGQIEQVIMNMAINARDAMPIGGKLILETASVSFDSESLGRYAELKPGDYVMLSITDTGTGMTQDVKAHVFEPFFSTKDVGKGTGLGLSTCYGIIKQSGGHISVYSEPGWGTTFKIYLPLADQQPKSPAQALPSSDLPRGTETILVVEDDHALRETVAALLKRLGYSVLTTPNGVETLNLIKQPGIGHIDLLFTDIVMPLMSGKELADSIHKLHPNTRILYTSAFSENVVIRQGVLNQGMPLLQKPFTPASLARKLREVLDQPPPPKLGAP